MTTIAKLRNGKTATITSINKLIHGYINDNYRTLIDCWWDLSGLALFEDVLHHPRANDIVNLDEVLDEMSQQPSFSVTTSTIAGRVVVITDVILEPASRSFNVKPFKGYAIFPQGSLPDAIAHHSWCADGCLLPYDTYGDPSDLSDPNYVYEQFKAAGRVTEYICPLIEDEIKASSVDTGLPSTVTQSRPYFGTGFFLGTVVTTIWWVIFLILSNGHAN